jgi:putative peptidoglycan lipid II flippase
MAIAIAALVGGAGQVAIQWPALRREGFRYRPVFAPGDPGLRQVLILMGPGTIGLAATQVNIFVNTLLATSQGTGAVSWLTYAFRVMYLPIGLFGVSIGTALLPAVSRYAAVDDSVGIRDTVARGLAMMMMVNVPATLGLIALATPIVQLLFERGHFMATDTAATAAALQCYALGLVGYSAVRIVSPTFYAIRQSRVPVMVSGAAVAINIVLSILLVRYLGFRGLALGTSIAAMANAAALVWLLRRRLDGLGGRRLLIVFAKIVIAATVMAVVSVAIQHEMNRVASGMGLFAQASRLAASIGAGLIALAAMATLLRVSEFAAVVTMLQLKVRKLLGGRM